MSKETPLLPTSSKDELQPPIHPPAPQGAPCIADFGALILRLITATQIVHHGQDKLLNVDKFTYGTIVPYFQFLPGVSPVTDYTKGWTYLAAGVEIVGCSLLFIGLYTRFACVLLMGALGGALWFHYHAFGLQHFPLDPAKGGAYTFEPALGDLGVVFYFLCAGPGRFAVGK